MLSLRRSFDVEYDSILIILNLQADATWPRQIW